MGGFTKIYEIGKNFRNEGISNKHNPEFTVLELYEAYGNYRSMINILEEMITCRMHHSFDLLTYGSHQISFSLPYRRVRLNQLVDQGTPEEQLRVYENEIEKTLINPTFVTHLPCSAVPLAKESNDYPGYAEVFELVIAGQEVGTGYTELNDPDIQLRNFSSQAKDGHCLDMEFVNAMKAGMPPAGGLGIDRLVAILTNQQSIRDIIPFPLLKAVEHDTIKTE
jgi:lysyl-tRNA synthetase class 2